MKEINITPREYQEKILETCKQENTLVILPTGTGKTLIAIMLAIERFKKFPLEKVLILAPTRPLIEQHLISFKKIIPEDWCDMQIFTGKTPAENRKKIWQTAEFIFSTPQCIANDLKHRLYDLKDTCLLIEDECHRCLKNYSYNFIAQTYKEQAHNPRILGLTASPGSDKQTITKVCENLGISAVEIRTRESEDVKPYLQELEFEKIEVDFPPEFKEIHFLLNKIYEDKIQELKTRKVLFSNYVTKITLLETQRKIMGAITAGKKDGNMLMSASVCSQAIKIQHALELLETQTLHSFKLYLQDLIQQSNEGKSKGVQRLVKDPRFMKAYTLSTTLNLEHPKLEKLIEIITSQLKENPNAKTIIFNQFRDSAKKITDSLNKIQGVKANLFVGQAKKGQGDNATGFNQKEQKQIIEDFKEGKINTLVATSIAEEGLDIPEVNEVIFYEPVPSAIRSIQRRGRTARLMKGALKILITRNTRDQAYHYASINKEKRMHKAISDLKRDIDNGETIGNQDNERIEEEENKEKQERLF